MVNTSRGAYLEINSELFWNRVTKYENGCWIWNGNKYSNGYGVVSISPLNGRQRTLSAHRVSFFLHNNIIPLDDLDHLCRNRICVNPFHLEVVSRRENLIRGKTIPAEKSKQTHCKYGHPLVSYIVRGMDIIRDDVVNVENIRITER